MKKKKWWIRKTLISKADRSFDIKFWQAQGYTVRFNTAFKMLEDFYKIRGKRLNADSFRLQRFIENLKQA